MLKSKKHLLTEDQYNLVVYCLENSWLEFTPQEEMDGDIIIERLKEVTDFKPVDEVAHTHRRRDLDKL
tara:strand:- start:285 stop:488 length:204 start_codon:yes stop_codon:yes gene_type:complete